MTIPEDIVAEALKLALAAGLPTLGVLAVLLVAAVLLVMVRRGVKWPRLSLEPQEPVDEGGALPPGTPFQSQPENDGHGTFGG